MLEKDADISSHQTGNNSGVIHSGLYYKPGSLKASNCREGYRQLLDFCRDEGIPHDTNIEQFVGLRPKLAGHFGGNSHLRFFAQSGCGHGDPREVGKFYQNWNLRQQKHHQAVRA